MLRVGLALCSLVWALQAQAAEKTIDLPLEQALPVIETALANGGRAVSEFAQTERFAIFYLHQEGQSTVTVTAFQLPQQLDRTTITVNTDSPVDEMLEVRFLESLITELSGDGTN